MDMQTPVIYISSAIFALQGRVEVRKNGIWGTICNDNTDENNWSGSLDFGSGVSTTQAVDDRAAEVICRQMGWTVGRAQQDASNQIWMDNLNCPDWPSDKTHVEQCEHNNKDDWHQRLLPHARYRRRM